jgi:regulatory protein
VPKITRLGAQKKRKNRVNVYLDDEYSFSLQAIVAMSLRVGQELGGEDIAALKHRDAVERAHGRSLHYLSFRPRSVSEVEEYLAGKGAEPEVVGEVTARLERVGLLDDEAFARYWVQNRESFRPRGPWLLRTELRRKGIADDIITEALAELDPEDSAYRAAEARARRLAHLDRRDFFRRVGDYLKRRGFSYSIVRSVVDRLWNETREPDQDRDLGDWTSGEPEDDIDV